MALFRVKGVKRDTNELANIKVEAADAAAAEARAMRHGYTVESVTPIAATPATSTAVVVAPPAMPAVPPALTRPAVAVVAPPPAPAIEQWQSYVADGQDASVVAKLFGQVQQVLTSAEQLLYIGVQKKPVMNVKPDAVALTTRRVIVYQSKLLGTTFEDFPWIDLRDARLQEGMLGATLSFQHVSGRAIAVDYLPKPQARALYRLAQEQEEAARLNRRAHELETARASSGAAQVAIMGMPGMAPAPTPAAGGGDMVGRLQSLKQMLDAGLINQAEFDAKKAEIMRSL